MRENVLSSVGAPEMDTNGYQVSDVEVTEFHWQDPDLNVEAVFRLGMDTPCSSSIDNDFEMGSVAEIPILVDEEQDKENTPRFPSKT